MTNAEKIRSMTKEELARSRVDKIDMYTSSDIPQYIGDFSGISCSEQSAISRELAWLRQEEDV